MSRLITLYCVVHDAAEKVLTVFREMSVPMLYGVFRAGRNSGTVCQKMDHYLFIETASPMIRTVSGTMYGCRQKHGNNWKINWESTRKMPVKSTPEQDASFIEDFEFLRDQGLSMYEIARSLGFTPASLRKKVNRFKLTPAYTTDQKLLVTQVESLIAKGRPFSSDDLSIWVDSTEWPAVMSMYESTGKVKRIGSKQAQFNVARSIRVYQAVNSSD